MGANADVVKGAWEAFGQQDVDRAAADIAESAEIVLQDSLPWGGTHRGPDVGERVHESPRGVPPLAEGVLGGGTRAGRRASRYPGSYEGRQGDGPPRALALRAAGREDHSRAALR